MPGERFDARKETDPRAPRYNGAPTAGGIPHGRHAGELAGLAATLAERGKLDGHEKYNNLGEVELTTPPSGVY